MFFNNPDLEQELIDRHSRQFGYGELGPPRTPEYESKICWGIERPWVPPVCSSQSHFEGESYRPDPPVDYIPFRRPSNTQHCTFVGILYGSCSFLVDKLSPRNWLKYSREQEIITFLPTFVLPTEAVNAVINMLDMESAFRFSCASKLTRKAVTNVPEYKELIQHASKPLGGLKARGAIGLHSVRQLSAALHSQQCAYCTEYGAFIFIVTSERCCLLCLQENPSLQVICFEDAERFFAVMEEEFDTLPSINILNNNLRLIPVASARMVKQLTHKEYYPTIPPCFRWHPYWTPYMQSRLSDDFTNEDPIRLPKPMDSPNEEWSEQSFFHFPSLRSDGTVENGIWCRACCLAIGENRRYDLSSLVPQGCDQARFFDKMAERARSRAGFLDHIKDCEKTRKAMRRYR